MSNITPFFYQELLTIILKFSYCHRILILKLANSVHYIILYLTKQEQRDLLLCIRELRDNKDSNCQGLRFPSITSLIITYYPHDADSLHKMKTVLPDLKRIRVRLCIYNWNQFSGLKSLSKALKSYWTRCC